MTEAPARGSGQRSYVDDVYASYAHDFMSQETVAGIVRYTPGCPLMAPGTTCAACGGAKALMRDHCHEHGWIRGIVCCGCNRKLGHIDRRNTPRRITGEHLAALLAVRNRCPDCEQIGADDLVPNGGTAEV